MMRRVSLIPTALLCVATVAFPCGGSNSYDVDGPLQSAAGFADRAISPRFELEFYSRAEVRFLPGLIQADSGRFASLVGRAPLPFPWRDTVSVPPVAEPTRAGLDAAWRRGDVVAAVREANAVIARIMTLPSSNAVSRDSVLRLAVETIELAPSVGAAVQSAGSDRLAIFNRLAAPLRVQPFDSMPAVLAREPNSPRRATLEYAALRLRVRDGIPNDTREEITKQVPAVRWDSLHAAHQAWLSRHPDHPYAGLVRFTRLRLFYLASQPDSAWDTAIALYRSYPARAAAEMRYMLQVGFRAPERLLIDARVPIELRASLVGNLNPSTVAWQQLMQLAAASRGARWSEGLEARLMAARAGDTSAAPTLPAGFPAWRESASPFWRYMWAVNMLHAGRLDDAVKFTARGVTAVQDSLLHGEAAMLSSRIHLMRGDWLSAASTPGIDQWTRRYIIRVLAPDSAVTRLRDALDPVVAREARLVVAMREAQAGKWGDASEQVRRIDSRRAALYTRIGALSLDTASNVGLARFASALGAAGGQLFNESSRYFYRGMMNRDDTLYPRWAADSAMVWDLPWTKAHERARLFRSLRDGSERYLSVRVYASYFRRPGVTAAQRRAAVLVADRTYRALLATDPSRTDSGYWADSLPASVEARAIRAAGRMR